MKSKSTSSPTIQSSTSQPDRNPETRRWSGRRTPKVSRRDEILRSVGDVLRESRLSSLTMQDIADRLGITKGHLYYYFRDKQDILFQCHMRCMDISLKALAGLDLDSSAKARLHDLLVQHIRGMIEDGLGSVLLTDLENLNATQRTTYVAKRDEFEAGVRHLIDVGVARKEFVCPDSKLASLTILGAINWVPKWYRPEGRLKAAEIAEGMAAFMLQALAAPAAAPRTTKKKS
jgi:AcrR family transcriptional regulator